MGVAITGQFRDLKRSLAQTTAPSAYIQLHELPLPLAFSSSGDTPARTTLPGPHPCGDHPQPKNSP